MPHHRKMQHRGNAMHLKSHGGKDGKVSSHYHSQHHKGHARGHQDMESIAHGYNPPEHYQGTENSPNTHEC